MWTYGLEPHAIKKCEVCSLAIPFCIQRVTRDIILAPQEPGIVKLTLSTVYRPGMNDYCSVSEEAFMPLAMMFSTVMGRMILPWDVKGICDSCWFNKKGKSYNERRSGRNSK
jgi:hypothetical protein